MTVEGDHVYYVGASGVLAHNNNYTRPPSWVKQKRPPQLVIDYTRNPKLADNIWHAQRAGHPRILTRSNNQAANRAAAVRDVPRLSGQSRDEYPFASTLEGGQGSWVGHIPPRQNSSQGGLIRNFFREFGIEIGDSFEVIVTNHPGGGS